MIIEIITLSSGYIPTYIGLGTVRVLFRKGKHINGDFSLKVKSTSYEEGSVGIAFRISKEANEYLTLACERTGRTKKAEAKMRLEDHLKRFYSITEIGIVSEK